MRRVLLTSSRSVVPGAVVLSSCRSIYTPWASTPQEPEMCKESWLKRITNRSAVRSFDVNHFPLVKAPLGTTFNSAEQYLYSAIIDDAERLMSIDWTYDFDSFWRDRVSSHVQMYNILYGSANPIGKIIFGNRQAMKQNKLVVEEKLNYLKDTLKWACETERRFSAIGKARYEMQREVFDALQREKYLAGCVDIVNEFSATCPQEYRKKAVGELQNQLMNMRHWVWDCPNAKRSFPRQLA